MLKRWFCSAIAILSLAAVSACNRGGGDTAQMTMPPHVVTVADVVTEDVPAYLDEIGRTGAFESVNIAPQVSGQIIKQCFKDGDNIKKGQTLFLIEPRPFQAVFDQAQAALQQADAQLSNARLNYSRVASELPSKAVSQQDYDNAKDSVDVAQANVKAAQAQIESAKWNLDNCTIVSPIDGRAGQRLVDVGNIVIADTTSLLSIQRVTPIYVDFTVAENELDRVRQNLAKGPLKLQVHIPGNEAAIDGQLNFLDNAVQDGTGTIKLRGTVPNINQLLWPGQFVNVRLILTTLKSAKLIPSEALQIGQQGPFVFIVAKNNTVSQQIVAPGQRQGDMIVIEKGLAGGETVVRSGQLMLTAGSPVVIQKPPSAGANPTASAGAGA